jgi:hypothetical protein
MCIRVRALPWAIVFKPFGLCHILITILLAHPGCISSALGAAVAGFQTVLLIGRHGAI